MTQVLIKNFLKPPKEKTASTRPQGKRVRQFILENWAEEEQFTIVFEKGLRATISFMDEAFAKLLEDHNPNEVLDKIHLQDASEYNQYLFFKVLRNRLVHGTSSTRKTRPKK